MYLLNRLCSKSMGFCAYSHLLYSAYTLVYVNTGGQRHVVVRRLCGAGASLCYGDGEVMI